MRASYNNSICGDSPTQKKGYMVSCGISAPQKWNCRKQDGFILPFITHHVVTFLKNYEVFIQKQSSVCFPKCSLKHQVSTKKGEIVALYCYFKTWSVKVSKYCAKLAPNWPITGTLHLLIILRIIILLLFCYSGPPGRKSCSVHYKQLREKWLSSCCEKILSSTLEWWDADTLEYKWAT